MKLHVLGLPHTRTIAALSHCAFTGKVRRFAQMMAPLGYECIHYGVGQPDSPGWASSVQVLSPMVQRDLLGWDPTDPSPEFIGRGVDVGSPLYRQFNSKLAALLKDRVQPDDWICAPFGLGHQEAVAAHLGQTVESGIGYYHCFSTFRIYESLAWMHWHLGRDQRAAWLGEFVIPNYFDVDEWPLRPTPPKDGGYVLYMGRLQPDKGLNIIWRLAKARPDLRFVLCGQGNAAPWLTEPNIEYRAPVHGAERAALMHGARCLLAPSQYVEPFGGVAVEAMLTGTPVLTTAFGAYTETNPIGAYRCRTFGDWMRGLELLGDDDPAQIQGYARARYGLAAVGPLYDRAFHGLAGIARDGWDSLHSTTGVRDAVA
jgi:hypothetical protein